MNSRLDNELALGKAIFGKKPQNSLKGDILERLNNLGLEADFDIRNPPLINKYSEMAIWQNGLSAIHAPNEYDNFHFHILRNDANRMTCIVWAKQEIPEETHHDWKESILLLEGSCDFRAGDTVTHYEAGTFIEVPDTEHEVIVTSAIPLKFIVQRLRIAS